MAKNRVMRYALISLSGLLSIIGFYFFFYAKVLPNQPNRLFSVPRGTQLEQIAHKLAQEGIIRNRRAFLWAAHLLRYNPRRVPGQYLIAQNSSYWKLIRLLRSGQQKAVKVTFAVAKNQQALAKQLTQPLALTHQALLVHLNDPKTLARYSFTTDNVLAMFIPDTYYVYWTTTTEQLLDKLYKAYQLFWSKERLHKIERVRLKPVEVSILASIVQAETSCPQEAKMIAGVYINRLREGMRLRADPTIRFILEQQGQRFENRILRGHTYIESPYNTYRHRGLPPGPIALPTVAMIDAVLDYVEHNYLYFVAKANFSGKHCFSVSYQSHLNHARKYRKALTKRQLNQQKNK